MAESSDRLITIREVCDRLACARTTLYRHLKLDETFPRPVRLSAGAVRFEARELEAWIAARPRTIGPTRGPGRWGVRAPAPEAS